MSQLVSMDGNHMLRAAPDATVGVIALSSAFASRPAAARKLPQPAHTIFGEVE